MQIQAYVHAIGLSNSIFVSKIVLLSKILYIIERMKKLALDF